MTNSNEQSNLSATIQSNPKPNANSSTTPSGEKHGMPTSKRGSYKGNPQNRSKSGKRYNKKKFQKKAKPQKKAAPPSNSYVSVCCQAVATKPRTGRRETGVNPENGKPQDRIIGLGKWRCGNCGKRCKVQVVPVKNLESLNNDPQQS